MYVYTQVCVCVFMYVCSYARMYVYVHMYKPCVHAHKYRWVWRLIVDSCRCFFCLSCFGYVLGFTALLLGFVSLLGFCGFSRLVSDLRGRDGQEGVVQPSLGRFWFWFLWPHCSKPERCISHIVEHPEKFLFRTLFCKFHTNPTKARWNTKVLYKLWSNSSLSQCAPYWAAMAAGLQNAMCTMHFGAVVPWPVRFRVWFMVRV